MPGAIRLLAIVQAIVAAGCGGSSQSDVVAPAASNVSFDRWADVFAADWVRVSPQLATRVKYFQGDEQDAVDRQLSMIGEWDYAFGRSAFGTRAASAKKWSRSAQSS